MPADAFKRFAMFAFPRGRAVRVFRTSGTTGSERGAHYFRSLALYDSLAPLIFERFALADGARLTYYFLAHPPQAANDSSLSYMFGLIDRRFAGGRGRFYVRRGVLESDRLLHDLRREKGPVFILTTAFALKALLDEMSARSQKLRLPRGSRLMETGGFKGRVREVSKSELYALSAARLGIGRSSCIGEYGMTELTGQFYETTLVEPRRRPVFRGPAWMRAVIVDPESGRPVPEGQKGLIRVFDLSNVDSALAVQTDDIGRAARGGFEVLGRAPGASLRGCSLGYESLLSL